MDDEGIRGLIAGARELARGLDRATLERLAAEARPRVAEWRWADAHSVPHRTEPWLAAREDRSGGWRSEGGDDVSRVGLDHEGRPLLVESHSYGEQRVSEVWEHHAGGSWVLANVRGAARATLLRGAETVVWPEHDGDGFAVERWTWRDGVPIRGDLADVSIDGWVLASAYEADVDDEGALRRLRRGASDSDIREETRIPAERVVDALLAGLRDAAAVECEAAVWRADLHRDEPVLRGSAELVDVLAKGLAAAVRRAVAAAGVERPFVVEFRPGADEERDLPLPGWILIGSERFRDRIRALSSLDGAAVQRLWKGQESGEAVRVSLADHCDAETLRACREVNTALSHTREFEDPDQQRARGALDALGARLAADLNREPPAADAAEPFLVLVEVGDPYGEGDGLLRARGAIGRDRVERFVASIASRVEEARDEVAAARRDRGRLEAWLRERGLGERAPDVAAAARPGYRLVLAGEGNAARSRIGGDGLLPPGDAWPRSAAGRPLSFLAGIDLGELPTDDVVPEAGWLLFFADLDDEGEALGFIGEPTPNEEGADARVLWVASGTEPVRGEPPADLAEEPHVRMPEHRVMARPQLTLEDGYDSGERLGLDAAQAEAYNEIAGALRDGPPPPRHEQANRQWDDEADDWVLGAVTGVQGHQPEDGTVLLLHLASVEFQDAGAIQFRIPEAALAARDWSSIYAEGDSA